MKKQKYTPFKTKHVPKTFIKVSDEDDDDDEETSASKFLGYFKKVNVSQLIEIPIDEDFKSPSYYRNICNAISNTSEDDIIRFNIASYGGRLDGLTSILAAVAKTDATTEAWINGPCKSAGAFLALSCDNVYVTPYADLMIHFASFGSVGKVSDVVAHVTHTAQYTEDLFRETFKYFLTDDEIERAIKDGKEYHMNAAEVIRRLEIRMEYFQKDDAENNEGEGTDE